MNYHTAKLCPGMALITLAMLTSCAPLSIDPPGAAQESLLVLPVTLTHKAEQRRYGFDYVYTITSDDNRVAPYQAVFRFPPQDDMLIVNSLPPGSYRVANLKVRPVGTGDHSYSGTARTVNEPFILAPGMITILSKSLNLTTYNAIPGRGASTSYLSEIEPVSSAQRRQILERLGQLENFQAWKVLDSHNRPMLRAQGSWSGSWTSSTGDCGNGDLQFAVAVFELNGSGTSARGEPLTIAASINEQGKVSGDLSNDQTRVAKVSGGIFSGGEMAGKFSFLDGCESQWSVVKQP